MLFAKSECGLTQGLTRRNCPARGKQATAVARRRCVKKLEGREESVDTAFLRLRLPAPLTLLACSDAGCKSSFADEFSTVKRAASPSCAHQTISLQHAARSREVRHRCCRGKNAAQSSRGGLTEPIVQARSNHNESAYSTSITFHVRIDITEKVQLCHSVY